MMKLRLDRQSLFTCFAAVVAVTAILAQTPAFAGDCCSSKGNAKPQSRAPSVSHQQHTDTHSLSMIYRPPHGGQVHATESQYYEVVYLPLETRVYFYGPDQQPVSPRGTQGQVAMYVRGHEQPFRFPLKYYTVAGGTIDQEYLAAQVDVTRVSDGAMMAVFELANLPDRQQPQVSFKQTFALTKMRPAVTVVALSATDGDAIARQRVCPITGGQLGSMGQPVKLMIGNQPLFVCCQGCIDKVRQAPEKYLPGPSANRQAPSQAATASGLIVTQATAADQRAIQMQAVCAVRKSPLGAMGTPIKVTRGGQAIFLCCQGCVSKVQMNPDYYFAQSIAFHPSP